MCAKYSLKSNTEYELKVGHNLKFQTLQTFGCWHNPLMPIFLYHPRSVDQDHSILIPEEATIFKKILKTKKVNFVFYGQGIMEVSSGLYFEHVNKIIYISCSCEVWYYYCLCPAQYCTPATPSDYLIRLHILTGGSAEQRMDITSRQGPGWWTTAHLPPLLFI